MGLANSAESPLPVRTVARSLAEWIDKLGRVWVEGHYGADGEWIEGYWRDSEREGFQWVEPYEDDEGAVEGHWEPLEARDGYVYEWGNRDEDGAYAPGFWREEALDGYDWEEGYYDNGAWVNGYWQPVSSTRSASKGSNA